MTIQSEVLALWPSASQDDIEAIVWMTPYPFVSVDLVIKALQIFRNKYGANIKDALNGEMDEFDRLFTEYRTKNIDPPS